MQVNVTKVLWKGAAGIAVVQLAGTFVACGGGDDSGDDNGGKPTAAASAAPTSDDDGEVSNDLKIVSKNTLFDKSKLRAKAGEITITHDNQDGGITHNVAVFKGSDAKGENVGSTELENGLVTQTLVLNLEPGKYFYVCEAHPATMYGTLTVEE